MVVVVDAGGLVVVVVVGFAVVAVVADVAVCGCTVVAVVDGDADDGDEDAVVAGGIDGGRANWA